MTDAIAIQMWLNRNRHMDATHPAIAENHLLDQTWRLDISLWKNLDSSTKSQYINQAQIYVTDWCSRYPEHADKLLANWCWVNF